MFITDIIFDRNVEGELLSSIKFNRLRYFLATVEHGSFRKASIALSARGSSISRGIRDLENCLGALLFERNHCGVVLTPAGKRFLDQAHTAMKHLDDGAREAKTIRKSEDEHLHISVFCSLASGFLYDLLKAYAADRTGVRIDFTERQTAEQIAAVGLHQSDVAFITGIAQYAECETMHLWSEQVFAVLPTAHPLADRQSLTWSDLIGETFIVSEQAQGREIHDFLVKELSQLGRHPEVRRQNVGRDTLMSLVAIGRGLALASEATTSTRFLGLVYRPLAGETLPFSAVWSAKNDNPALHRLLSMARARRKIVEPFGMPIVLPIQPRSAVPSRTRDRLP